MASEKSPAALAKLAFAIAVLSQKSTHPEDAALFFQKAIDQGTKMSDYAHYFLGLIALEKKNLPEAKKQLLAVLKTQPTSIRKADAELQLALIARQEERFGEAISYLTDLEKKYRNDPQHAEILFSLFEVSQAKKTSPGNSTAACSAALKIYARYPLYGIAKGWTFDLSQPFKCVITRKDQEKRFGQLFMGGEFAQVRIEAKFWQEKLRANPNPHPVDMSFFETQLGHADMSEGKIKDAIAHFTAAQDLGGRNFDSQMMLGRAYSQTDDYPAAVQSFLRAYQMNPRSKSGQKALFQAAFLSYQNQDYDGAARKFEELLRYAHGKIAWNSQWHLAWIRYLKEDYDGALKAFNLLAQKKKLDRVDGEKLQYWKAMSLLRLGFTEEARPIFKNLTVQKRLGYYTGAAIARLSTLPSEPKLPELKELKPSGVVTPGAVTPAATPAVTPVGDLAVISLSRKLAEEESADKELEKISDKISDKDSEKDTEKTAKDLTPGSLDYSSVKDPALVSRFERVKDLIDLNFTAWARAELFEIEKRTRNIHYLELLMSDYAKVGDYNRAAYLADVTFSDQREKEGTEGASKLWNFAFPQAFGKSVLKYAKRFDVQPALVWSIMRGESVFKYDTVSSAGAMGLMQLITPTAKRAAQKLKLVDFKREMLLDPEINIMLGTWYLQRLGKVMEQNLPLAIGSYNAGPHHVQAWLLTFGKLDQDEFIEHIPYVETRNYVKKVLRNYFVYQTLYEHKSNSLAFIAQKLNVKFNGPKPSVENWDD